VRFMELLDKGIAAGTRLIGGTSAKQRVMAGSSEVRLDPSSEMFDKDEVIGTKVLVCSLHNRFDELLNGDAEIYRHQYPATATNAFASIQDLMEALTDNYDVVHLFCDVTSRGEIIDNIGNKITGTQLIQRCGEENVKLLWIASDNQPDGYIADFKPHENRLNLVMTINRNGPKFPDFLRKLLFQMFSGKRMPVAWVELCPQHEGPNQADMPSCIFAAFRETVRLR